MDLNKLTIKSQEALGRAQQAATESNHQQVEPVHLLVALLAEPEGVVFPLLQKLGASPRTLMTRAEELLARVPKVYGNVEKYLSPASRALVESAFAEAETLGDAYVSTEHLFLAMLDQGDDVAGLLRDAGIERASVLGALKEIRGSQRVTDQTPEDKYQSLERFGRDLTDAARSGKLDPVIGRDEEIRRVIQVLS
ncbi:MAG TPA: Clp protease N-terminal domain-containing protein, partial [Actinomycetota bacterium]|nr:Clp protease N-terminal domain-containing protein [Actinomycetota bacterium]